MDNNAPGPASTGGYSSHRRRKEITVSCWDLDVIRFVSRPVLWNKYIELWDAGLLKFQKEKQPKPDHYPTREEALVFAAEDSAATLVPNNTPTLKERGEWKKAWEVQPERPAIEKVHRKLYSPLSRFKVAPVPKKLSKPLPPKVYVVQKHSAKKPVADVSKVSNLVPKKPQDRRLTVVQMKIAMRRIKRLSEHIARLTMDTPQILENTPGVRDLRAKLEKTQNLFDTCQAMLGKGK